MGTFQSGTVVESATRNSDGSSAGRGTSLARKVHLTADCTARSGVTPTLDLEVEWSHDGTNWSSAQPADTFTEITAVSAATKTFDVKAPLYRVTWDVGGTTPSFTFAVHEYTT